MPAVPISEARAQLGQSLALTALVYLTRNSVLRAREVFADVRASVPDGPHGALRRILGGLPSGSGSAWRLWRACSAAASLSQTAAARSAGAVPWSLTISHTWVPVTG